MTAPATTPAARTSTTGLQTLLWAISGAVVVQAVLAGLFLTGFGAARMPHLVIGATLPWFGIAPAVAAGVHHRRGTCPPGIAVVIYLLPVLLFGQEVLGHLPAAASTAVHVPFGVTLAVVPTVLATRLRAVREAGSRRGTGTAGHR